jgi:hypothetical protein
VIYEVKKAVLAIQNCLSKRPGLQCDEKTRGQNLVRLSLSIAVGSGSWKPIEDGGEEHDAEKSVLPSSGMRSEGTVNNLQCLTA